MPAKYMARMQELYDAIDKSAGKGAAKGIFQPIIQWPAAYTQLRVCFFGGSTEVRRAVAEIASQWESATTGISFDWGGENFRTCGKDETKFSHIRVGFDQPGSFSMVGSASVHYAKLEEPSLNLEGVDKMTPDQIKAGRQAGTIRHEFGHALGLQHEHQSPRSVCEKDFNWQKIYDDAAKGEQPWDKTMVDQNFRVILDPDAIATKYDAKSVMKYSFPPEWFVNGDKSKCFSGPPNDEISKFDRALLAFMYPPKQQAAVKADKMRLAKLKKALGKAPPAAAATLKPLLSGEPAAP
jgi:Astacin (Peptidase family M12A)